MNMQRKWRFVILIGAGLIAAGAVAYFSNGRISNDKTQGAIGNRDVYRDGQVASADVAKPGTAPVATEAILKSSEFKALAKNPAFQALLRTDAFNELGRKSEFTDMLANADFRRLAQDSRFAAIIGNVTFQAAMKNHEGLSPALRAELRINEMAERKAFDALLVNHAFRDLVQQHEFRNLIAGTSFKALLRDQAFGLLMMRQDFRAALQEGTAARLVAETGRR